MLESSINNNFKNTVVKNTKSAIVNQTELFWKIKNLIFLLLFVIIFSFYDNKT